MQLDFVQDVHPEDDDENVPPDLTPKPEKSFFTSVQPHFGHAVESAPAGTSSSNFASHFAHLNS